MSDDELVKKNAPKKVFVRVDETCDPAEIGKQFTKSLGISKRTELIRQDGMACQAGESGGDPSRRSRERPTLGPPLAGGQPVPDRRLTLVGH